MADIRINATGDASGAVKALEDVAKANKKVGDAHHQQLLEMQKDARDAGKAQTDFWEGSANAAKLAAAAVVAFGAHALKSYSDSERIQRQLTRAAGEYGGEIAEQSKALSQLYAIDDDIINQSAILLTQWGGAGAAARNVEEAVLNLAAGMGKDLNTATQELIRNVESGGTGLAKMGIHFKATGDKGKDLEAAVAAINKSLGGAAKADADSLSGQAAAATVALGDLQKGFGELIAAMLEKSNAITWVRDALASYQEVFFGNEAQKKNDDYLKMHEKLLWSIEHRKTVMNAITQATRSGNMAEAEKMVVRLADLDKEVEKLKALLDARNKANQGGGLPGVTGTTNKGGKDAASAAESHNEKMKALQERNITDFREWQRAWDAIDDEALEDQLANSQKSTEDTWRRVEEEEKARERLALNDLEFKKRMAKIEDDARLDSEKDGAALEEKSLKDQSDRVGKQEQAAREAGDQVGAAMVNALADQLSKLAEGGEFDAVLFVGDILGAAVGVAGTIIGSALGAPAVGAAIGNLAAMGIRAGASGISSAGKRKPRTYHDGGWVDAPRHHDGTWIGADEQRAILQTGERVLSRKEVAASGGPQAVDGMAKGRGGMTLNITAIDAKSMADTFSGAGADGLKQALRRGHGALPALLGRGPR